MKTLHSPISVLAVLIVIFMAIFTSTLLADFSGRTGRTLKSGSTGCNCHGSQAAGVSVVIAGPDTLNPSMQATYSVTITGGPMVSAGVDIAASTGTLAIVSSDLKLSSSELTHTSPKTQTSGSVVFQFKFTAPVVTGNITLYATGISCNNTGSSSGDQWNFASNKTVAVITPLPVELTSFTAATINNSIKLNWATATELNNFGFRIERKDNNSIWKNIGFVHGQGTSILSKEYSFIDKNVLGNNHYNYRLIQVDNDGTTTYSKEIEINADFMPAQFSLEQNYPNPFNPSTTIRYSIPVSSFVSIKVFNAIGKVVADLVNEMQSADVHSVNFDASKLSSGIYFYTIKAGSNFTQTKKMILIK